MSNEYEKGTTVTSGDGARKGELTGSHYGCRMEGCRGLRLATRWPGGVFTYPCTKGMEFNSTTGWKIL